MMDKDEPAGDEEGAEGLVMSFATARSLVGGVTTSDVSWYTEQRKIIFGKVTVR